MASPGLPADPYRWLEDAESPATRKWLSAQRRHSATGLPAVDRDWVRLFERTQGEADGRPLSPPTESSGLVLRHLRDGAGEALVADSPDGPRQEIITGGRRPTWRISAWRASPDCGFLAVQLQHHGHENGGLHLHRLGARTAEARPPVRHLADASPQCALAFAGDWLLYSSGARTAHTLTAVNLRDDSTHAVGLPVRGPVRLALYGDSGDHVVMRTSTPEGTTTGWWTARWAGDGPSAWASLPLTDMEFNALDAYQGVCYTAGTAVHTVDLDRAAQGEPAQALLLSPPAGTPDVRVLRAFGPPDAPRLAMLRQAGLSRRLEVVAARHPQSIETRLDWPARIRLGRPGRGPAGSGHHRLWFLADDPRHGVWSGTLTVPPHGDPDRRTVVERPVRTERTSLRTTTVTSRDGTTIPLTVCDPTEDAAEDALPTLVTVYGGFGVTLEPVWDPLFATWLRAGGRVVWVHARGGGEFGATWTRAGRGAGKRNTVDDLCAAARGIVERGLTPPCGPAAVAASNGGLVVAAALVDAPALFAAAVCAAPLTDMARYDVEGLGPLWKREYGDPRRPDDLRGLLSYSPYHRVRPGLDCPPVLFVTGANDARVPPWHAWKLCAALQDATVGTAAITLHHYSRSGHSGPAGPEAHDLAPRVLTMLSRATGLRPRLDTMGR